MKHTQYLDVHLTDKNGNPSPRWKNLPEGKRAPRGSQVRTVSSNLAPATHTWDDAIVDDALSPLSDVLDAVELHEDFRPRRRRRRRGRFIDAIVQGLTLGTRKTSGGRYE